MQETPGDEAIGAEEHVEIVIKHQLRKRVGLVRFDVTVPSLHCRHRIGVSIRHRPAWSPRRSRGAVRVVVGLIALEIQLRWRGTRRLEPKEAPEEVAV